MTELPAPPAGASTVFDDLSAEPTLWLRDVPGRASELASLDERHPGIRRTGVYLIRDAEGPPELYYVGKIVSPSGIAARLSIHQKVASSVLPRWYRYLNPEEDVADDVPAGDLRDQIREAAAGRLVVAFSACAPDLAGAVLTYVIRHGLPGIGAPPVLNSPNWQPPIPPVGLGNSFSHTRNG